MSDSASKKIGKLRSMTGFAPLAFVFEDWSVRGDIRAVNGRGLDVRLRVPDWIEELEPALRKLVQAKVARGSVILSLRVHRDASSSESRLNQNGLVATLDMLAEIEAQALAKGVQLAPLTAADVAGIRGVIEITEDKGGETAGLRNAITKAVSASLVDFDADREREGAALAKVLSAQISEIEAHVTSARGALGDRAEAAKAAMSRALSRILETTDSVDEARVAQELAIVAVKSDVAEELDRLDTHIAAARDLLASDGAVGRKLDFLMQEFNREANTLCSKAQSSELTSIGLDLKAVIDQMREQVQNLE